MVWNDLTCTKFDKAQMDGLQEEVAKLVYHSNNLLPSEIPVPSRTAYVTGTSALGPMPTGTSAQE